MPVRRKIVKKGPNDCIVGVSGGKDSSRQAHWIRDRLGVRPLLVCCGYPPKQIPKNDYLTFSKQVFI